MMFRLSDCSIKRAPILNFMVSCCLGKKKEAKSITVTDRDGPWIYMSSSFSHFLENRLTDGGKLVSLTHRPPFTPQEDSLHSFLLQAKSTLGL
jgi:hypothetical protein